MFDPISLSPYLSLNWISLGVILILPVSMWLMKSKLILGFSLLLKALVQELSLVLGKSGSSDKMILVSFFLVILLNNFAGLFPYVFTASSHLTISLSLSLPLWTGYMLLNIFKNSSKVLAHLVPSGTPSALAPFMVLIEVISNFMRPLTLSVRLAANMVAGHLLLSLLSSPLSTLPMVGLVILMVAVIGMMILEMGVALIQSYVFMTLSSLYIEEVNNLNNKL